MQHAHGVAMEKTIMDITEKGGLVAFFFGYISVKEKNMFLSHKGDLGADTWRVLEQYSNTSTLLRRGEDYLYQSNICPHQGSRIRSGSGNSLPVCLIMDGVGMPTEILVAVAR